MGTRSDQQQSLEDDPSCICCLPRCLCCRRKPKISRPLVQDLPLQPLPLYRGPSGLGLIPRSAGSARPAESSLQAYREFLAEPTGLRLATDTLDSAQGPRAEGPRANNMTQPALSIALLPLPVDTSEGAASSPNTESPRSAPLSSPSHAIGHNGEGQRDFPNPAALRRASLTAPPAPIMPSQNVEPSKTLFSNVSASKSSARIPENSMSQVPDLKRSDPKSDKILSHGNSGQPLANPSNVVGPSINPSQLNLTALPTGINTKASNTSLSNSYMETPRAKKIAGKRFPQILRNQSVKDQEAVKPSSRAAAATIGISNTFAIESSTTLNGTHGQETLAYGMRTAPLEKERSFRDMMSSSIRNRSADRHNVAVDSEDEGAGPSLKEKPSMSSSFKDGHGASALLSNIKHGSSRAADGIGKAGKGIFGKFTRSGSGNEGPRPDEEYVCKVITLPLIEQTRRTRISPRLADAKDKTEFWMPALPWRCIDYLNLKGFEAEGLYRVPGSGKDVKHWQMRFDTEFDINLIKEPDLYDVNIIGSMFKAWLRELPDELLPKATQNKIAEVCKQNEPIEGVPQIFRDELSKLPPYNYYLLFAITCHLKLLYACSDLNKMDYRNLCICFQPCLKIDGFCFQWLVTDWENCWQGCWTEKDHLAEELRIEGYSSPRTERALTGTGRSGNQTNQRSVSNERYFARPNGGSGGRRSERSAERAQDRAKLPTNTRRVMPPWTVQHAITTPNNSRVNLTSNGEAPGSLSKKERVAHPNQYAAEDRTLSSADSGSTKLSNQSNASASDKVQTPDKVRPPPIAATRAQQRKDDDDASGPPSSAGDGDLPTLEPMRPLSPIGSI